MIVVTDSGFVLLKVPDMLCIIMEENLPVGCVLLFQGILDCGTLSDSVV